MKTETRYLGTFEVGEKVIITDPCYDRVDETNDLQGVVDVEPGNWAAEIVISDEGVWGKRVAELYAYRESHRGASTNLYLASCGVDSGQLGFFDLKKYPDTSSDYNDEDGFYREACNETYQEKNPDKKAGIVDGMGVNSSSGFGDGRYNVYVAENGDKVVAIKAVFIGDEDDYDDYD